MDFTEANEENKGGKRALSVFVSFVSFCKNRPLKVEISFDNRVLKAPTENRKDVAPGASAWRIDKGKITGIVFACPCGCGQIFELALFKCPGALTWEWNGNKEKPSLTPSIQIPKGCTWHGYLTAGFFNSV